MAATYRTSFVFGNAVSGTEPSGAGTPVVGDVWFCFCAAKGNTNDAPTCSDNNPDGMGASWQPISNGLKYNTADVDRFSSFVRNAKFINTVSTTVTVAIGAHTNTECVVVAVQGAYLVGAPIIRAYGFDGQDPSVTPTVNLTQSMLTTNMSICALGYQGGGAVAPPTGWTERQEVNQGGGASVEIATRDSGFTGNSVAWNVSALTVPSAAIVIELDGSVASLDYNVEVPTSPAKNSGDVALDTDVKAVALAGSGISPIPYYHLACFDTLGVRNYWKSTDVSLTVAPTPAGGATYVAATLTVLEKIGC